MQVPSNTANATTPNLTITGLPAGAVFIYRIAPNYTTVSYTSTGYTTKIPIYISPSTNTTYHGAVPWQYQGAGTTVAYNGVTYTMLTNTPGTCSTQIFNSNGLNDFCSFYVYLNNTLWNANESAELKASNASLATAKLVVGSITNKTGTGVYGTVSSSGTVLAAGQTKKNATYNLSTKAIIFQSVAVAKAPSPACITVNLVPTPYCQNATTPLKISVPVFNGHYGIFGNNTWYPLNITFSAAQLAGNPSTFNYSVIDRTANQLLTPNGSLTSSSFATTLNFKVPVTDSVEIALSGTPTANYSGKSIDPITVPTNAVWYVPITVGAMTQPST
ncbi:MAG: hypothetical protein ACREBW_10560, partial [Candidatus Micrarchaeaceae archaeon]